MINSTRTLDLDACHEFRIFKEKIEKVEDVRITSTRITNQGWKIYLDYVEKVAVLLTQVTGAVWGRRAAFNRLEGDFILSIQHCEEKSLLSLEFRIHRDFNTNDVSLSLIRLTDRLSGIMEDYNLRDGRVRLPRTTGFFGRCEKPYEGDTLIRSQMLAKIDNHLYRKQIQQVAAASSLSYREDHLKRLLDTKSITIDYFFDLAKTKSGYRSKAIKSDRESERLIINWLSSNAPSNVVRGRDIYDAFVTQLKYNGYQDILDGLTNNGSRWDKTIRLEEILSRSSYPWSWDLTMNKVQRDWVRENCVAKLTPLNVAIVDGILDAVYKPSDWHIDPDTITEK